jgi:ubiquinone/menaquinone biosynthesis C-methylase UbiE
MTATKAYKGLGMEGFVAKWYASTTQKGMDDYTALARRVAETLAPDSTVLEIAPGPGFFSIALAKRGAFRVTGLDISKTFVDLASARAADEHVSVDFRLGNASAMPFADQSFDFCLCRAAFKNFSEPVRAIQEMYRVLKPGGRAVIIDLRKDAPQKSIDQYVDGLSLNPFSAWTTKMTFKHMLLRRAYTRPQLDVMIAQTSFKKVDIANELMGFEITLTR